MKRKRQTACKPGSVPAVAGDGHSSGTFVAERLVRPTRAAARKLACLRPKPKAAAPIWSCSRWGLPCHSRYRERGALLPHPFTLTHGPCGARAVCFLWHCPWGRPRRALPGTVFPWSPDFPPRADFSIAAGRPSGRLALPIPRQEPTCRQRWAGFGEEPNTGYSSTALSSGQCAVSAGSSVRAGATI